ncbi:RNA pyrophosphohydrolase [Parasphingopyxis sp.]|uniref:RNA pyrophosphohydrolase n=1 Tax=Parasphingopyxis sp. TaxID=1920299 RepID=UPI002628DFFB|nr:RNA pyrophosphohydrolase [Parasphingopyxis sp.]
MTKSADLPYRPCAGVMLLNHSRQVFVGQRMDSSSEAWQMPQGGIDKDEDAESAAFRELEEETGIAPAKTSLIARASRELQYDLPDELIGKIWKGRYRGQRQSWFLARFEGADSDVNIETDHQEFRAWKWADPLELPRMIVPFKKRLYKQLLAEFSDYL